MILPFDFWDEEYAKSEKISSELELSCGELLLILFFGISAGWFKKSDSKSLVSSILEVCANEWDELLNVSTSVDDLLLFSILNQ